MTWVKVHNPINGAGHKGPTRVHVGEWSNMVVMVAEKGHTGRAVWWPRRATRAELARGGKRCTGRVTMVLGGLQSRL